MKEQIPCIDCITLPICKAVVVEIENQDSYHIYYAANKLVSKCNLIEPYMMSQYSQIRTPQFDVSHVKKVLNYLLKGSK